MSQLSDPVILVVDADPITLASVRTALDCRSYEVHTAQDEDSALELARHLELDLVIVDALVGATPGEEILIQIRRIPGREDVPVMFSASNQLPDVIRRAHEFGAAFHVRKPVDPRVLLELVSKALWMPHLVHTHLEQKKVRQPHMPMPGVVAQTIATQMNHSQ